MADKVRPRSARHLQSLHQIPDMPAIDEERALVSNSLLCSAAESTRLRPQTADTCGVFLQDKSTPLPEIKKLPIAHSEDAGGQSNDGQAVASETGGGGPGVDGSVSARTYFREHRDRMLYRGQEVRNYESAEIAFLTSCRLRNHFSQVVAAEDAKTVQEAAKEAAQKKAAAQNAADTAELLPAPAPRDRQFRWLTAALETVTLAEESRISNDSLDALLNKVGMRLGAESVRMLVEWLMYPDKVPEEDPILHDILVGTEEAAAAKAARELAEKEAAAAAKSAAAKAASEAAAAAARAAAAAEVDRLRRANAHVANADLLLPDDLNRAATSVGGAPADEGAPTPAAPRAPQEEAEEARQLRLRAEKTAHMRRRFKFDDPMAGQKKKVEEVVVAEEEPGPVFVELAAFVRQMTKSKVYVFGSNEWGQLALQDNNCVHTAKFISVMGEVDKVYAGGSQTWIECRRAGVSVDPAGKVSVSPVTEVWVAGRNEHGQLGLGHTDLAMILKPLPALENAKVVEVSLGAYHTLVMLRGGKVLACGWNRWGQLGLGDTEDRHELAPVTSLDDKGVAHIACGAGFSVALCSNCKIFSWGSNLAGQLGLGFLGGGRFPHFHEEGQASAHTSKFTSRSPTAPKGSTPSSPTRLEGGGGGGGGGGSPLRRGAVSRTSSNQPAMGSGSSPVALEQLEWKASYCSTPCMVPGVLSVKGRSITCGGLHTVVLGASGNIIAWGGNHEGQAGLGRLDHTAASPEKIYSVSEAEKKCKQDSKDSFAKRRSAAPPAGDNMQPAAVHPTAVQATEPTGAPAMRVSCGYSHTMMLTDKGEVYACGASTYGQLGTSGSNSVLKLTKLWSMGFGSDPEGPTRGQKVRACVCVYVGESALLGRFLIKLSLSLSGFGDS